VLSDDAIVRLLGAQGFDREAVAAAVDAARAALPEAVQQALAESGLEGLAEAVLLEGQFGSGHFALSPSRHLYYRIRPLVPAAARALLRRGVVSRGGDDGLLRWPVEDRFVSFVEQARLALDASGPGRALPWWPSGHRFAVVLTHDVEGPFGLSHLQDVLALESARGFRSSVSFVGDTYRVPDSLLRELREAGFEVALHGWRHNGRLFESRARFEQRLPGMNARLRQWGAVGFRSPMTHREPSWMQGLEVEWDSSFFDTDPFEPLPGGVMSIWPFVMGRFVELPYTLPQDHTLIETLGETSPRVWLEKLDYIAAHQGMALVNTHPDYLCRGGRLSLYEEFLDELARRSGSWHALPRDVAAWTLSRWNGADGASGHPAVEDLAERAADPHRRAADDLTG
jgi:peptidoglycan/xylan/chitin deacetylase (PgdA/CDA1 family)